MKGIELPINTLIIIVIALVILISLIAIFYNVWPITTQTANLEAVKNSACQMLLSIGGCDALNHDETKTVVISNFDADKDSAINAGSAVDNDCNLVSAGSTSQDNLFMLCKCYFFVTGATEDELNDNCKKNVCNCQTS